MPLIDQLVKANWVDKAVDRIYAEASDADDKARPFLMSMAAALKENKQVAKGMIPGLFVGFASRVSLGQIDKAKALWVSEQPDFDARKAARLAAGAATVTEARDTDKGLEDALKLAKIVLQAGGQYAIQALILAV